MGSKPLLIFLDTEFTDFVHIDLISIALVTEDGHCPSPRAAARLSARQFYFGRAAGSLT